jgi:hypothetical protein
MVGVNPNQKLRPHRVAVIYDSVSIPAIGRFVEHREREKSIWVVGRGLRGDVPEQVLAAVDIPIAISIQRQPAVC